ncbi:RagB/SusD family nutrient uptake outer membrane protein [Mucilaginibacter sp. RCC_168]|uniref:RagB/SusD family nutrient uptake outer membrane protein n=1 Tax=Mucilaginibacter sp. RCC_168 TaxID=3239221 RepID=UPI0035244F0E
MKYLIVKNKLPIKAFAILLIGAIAIVTSCSKILDKKPLNEISEEAVFTDPAFLQSYVYDVYNGVRLPWSPGAGGYESLTDVAVDQPETHDRAAGIREYLQGLLNPDNVSDLTNIWNEEYGYIRKANIFFEKTASSSISPVQLNPMKGEVHFLRAWMYFELMRTYGGVPIITKSFSLTDNSFDVPRNTYDECAKFVLDECESSISLLNGVTPVPGKVSKEAAMALKARILLYMASPLNNPSNDLAKWRAAETATKAVIDAGFTLHPTHEDLFKKPLKTDEIIFGRSFTPGNRQPGWGQNYDYWPSGFDALQKVVPTQTLINMFQLTNGQYPYTDDGITVNAASGYDPQNPNINRDPRYYSDILYPGCAPVTIHDDALSTTRTYEFWEDGNPGVQNPNKPTDPVNGQPLNNFGRDSKSSWIAGIIPFFWRVQTGYTFKKLVDFNGPRATMSYDFAQIVSYLRLSEFYLNYAEIQIALGDEATARRYINMVRKRPSVNMPPITSSGAALTKDYRNERAVELLLEDSRFFDLMRWKAAPGHVDIPVRGLTSVTMDWAGTKPGDLGKLTFTYGVIPTAEVRSQWKGDYYYLFPIPNVEIKKSNGSIKQNPGY